MRLYGFNVLVALLFTCGIILASQQFSEKARLQAAAKAAEDARRKAEEAAAAEVRRKRELEREAARQALQKVKMFLL